MLMKGLDAPSVAERRRTNAQSAMEYLMTYGWAILIIAIVLGALFSLGVFSSSSSLGVREPPGSCTVYRPYGSGSTAFLALNGACSGVVPEYVAEFGNHSSVVISNDTGLNIDTLTVTAWAKSNGPTDYGSLSLYNTVVVRPFYWFVAASCGTALPLYMCYWDYKVSDNPGEEYANTSAVMVPGRWYFIAAVMNESAGTETIYVDGKFYLKGGYQPNPTQLKGVPTVIGYSSCCSQYMNGSISNVQIYNKTLTQNQISLIYNAGIGGAPVFLNSLQAWWPLDGTPLDYSGNMNDGVSYNVVYSSDWESGYSQP